MTWDSKLVRRPTSNSSDRVPLVRRVNAQGPMRWNRILKALLALLRLTSAVRSATYSAALAFVASDAPSVL
jgi:hypothetical protein